MLYPTAQAWREAPKKRVLIFAMSGLGKTHVSEMLAEQGSWFHYSVDYRIGTRYMGELIADNAKREAMKVPFLRDLLRSDSIYIGSNISFNDLRPMSSYLGKPGDPAKGGLDWDEYTYRQDKFQAAEIAALHDTGHFIDRSNDLYQYPHFVCDTGGSICEWVDADNPDDPILKELSKHTLMVWIKGDEAHTEELIRRFDRAPKPMYYKEDFLRETWAEYLSSANVTAERADPDAFIRYGFAKLIEHRRPRYQAIADQWGVTVEVDDIAAVETPEAFDELIADTLQSRAKP